MAGNTILMSAGFDLEDDLDVFRCQELAAVPSINKTLVLEGAPGGAIRAEKSCFVRWSMTHMTH